MTHDGVVLAGPVVGLDRAEILGPCVLGEAGASETDEPLVLGDGVIIRAFAVVYRGTVLGPGVAVGHGAMVRERNVVGDGASNVSLVTAGLGTWAPGNLLWTRTPNIGGWWSSIVESSSALGPRGKFVVY